MSRQSNLLSSIRGLLHGFGNAAESVPQELVSYWEKRPSWHQVHGAHAAEVLFANQDIGDADALFSAAPGIPIAIQTADCVPILLARRDGRAVAAVHAGWRGTRARILRELWKKLTEHGETPAEWVAAIGPAIGPCCYQVSPELAADFSHEFASLGGDLVLPVPDHLDLPAINAAELKAIGVRDVELIRSCTFCAQNLDGTPMHRSYRREKTFARQWSGLVIAPERRPFNEGTF